MAPVKGATTYYCVACHASPCIVVTGLAPVIPSPDMRLTLNRRQCLHIPTLHEIIKGNIQFLLACLRVATICNRGTDITGMLFLTCDKQFNQLRRIDKRERTSIGATILVEYATKRLASNS